MKKRVCFILLLFCSVSHAQLLTNDNAAITVTTGAQVTVKGDVQNQNGGTINNSGTIDLNGHWINNAANTCFGTSQGTVILNGVNQNIGGANSTTFNNLTLQGGGVKTLLVNTTTGGGNATPSGTLSLGTSLLDLNSKTLTIANSATTAVSRTSGFIQSETTPAAGYGIIKWNTGTAAAGNNYVFPFGNSTTADFLPVNFNVTTAGTGATGAVAIATYPTTTSASPNNRPLPTGLTSLMNASSGLENAHAVLDRFWIFDVTNYTTEPVSTLGFTYREREWDGSFSSTNAITETQLQAQFNNGAVWSSPPSGSVNTTANLLAVSGVNKYNTVWVLVGSNNPLPVELLDFTASPVDNKTVKCSWITASEINNEAFTVERSIDGTRFESIGKVKGAGNSTVVLNYSFIDNDPYSGISYYRLKQNDFDGKSALSGIVAVMISSGSSAYFHIYPNPAHGTLNVILDAVQPGEYILTVFDISGRAVSTRRYEATRGMNTFHLEVDKFSAGIYYLGVQSDGLNKFSKLVLE